MAKEDKQRTVLSNRVLGEVLPISIATALAIESLIGKNPDAPVVDDHLGEIDILKINVRTLVRNLVGAIQKEDKDIEITGPVLIDYVCADINVINTILSEYAEDTLAVMFYVPTYNAVYTSRYKHGILKVAKTPKQVYNHNLELYVVDHILKHAEDVGITNIESMDSDMIAYPGHCATITHYPVDLLSRYNFTSLSLLESHTGALKGSSEWNTKLTGGKVNVNLPFDRATLQVFGDGVMFMSSKSKLRNLFLEMADKHKWTPRSTKELVIFSSTQINDVFFENYVKELYRK